MFVNVPDVTVQQAGLQTIDIGHVNRIIHVHEHHTTGLGSVHLHMPPVDVSLPLLSDIHVTIPRLTAQNLPAAQSATITNTAPLDVPTTLTLSNPPGFGAGLLKVVLRITASALAHILPFLEIHDVGANATVGQVELHNIGLPYDVLNLTLSQVGINTIGVPAFTVS